MRLEPGFDNCTRRYLEVYLPYTIMQDHFDDFAISDLDKLEKLAENFEWLGLRYNGIKEVYHDKYVAIQDRQIVDYDKDLDNLMKRLDIRNIDKSIAIDFIN